MRELARYFAWKVLPWLLLGLGLGALLLDQPEPEPADRHAEISTMIDWYGCWEGPTPKGAEANHAVVSYRGGQPNLVSAVLGYEILRHPDQNPGMTVHALCP